MPCYLLRYIVCVEKLGCNILFITDSYFKEIVPTVDVIGLTENTQDIYKHEKTTQTVAPTERAPSRSIYVRRHFFRVTYVCNFVNFEQKQVT